MNIYLLILGMGIVTYLPRLLPMVLTQGMAFPKWLTEWLGFVPYAVLGALIFPGILQVDAAHPWIGVVGGGFAAGIALIQHNVIFVVVGGIVAVFLLQQVV